MRRLIVGCGYLGQRVAAKWKESGGTVYVLTRSAEHAAVFQEQGLQPIIGDVLDPASLEQLPQVDSVFWAVGWDRQSGRSMQEVYVTGLDNVFQRMKSQCRRFIAISSTSVYGQNQGEWVDEQSPCVPLQANGQTCLAAEHLLLNLAKSSATDQHVQATVIRLSGIYGPGRLLSRVATLKSGEPLSGNPEAWLNLIHVDDAAEAVIKCEVSKESLPTLLVSDDEPIQRREYYSLLAGLVGAPPPRFNAVGDAAGQTPPELNKRCHNYLAKQTLGWSPQFGSCREGLPQAVQTSG